VQPKAPPAGQTNPKAELFWISSKLDFYPFLKFIFLFLHLRFCQLADVVHFTNFGIVLYCIIARS